MDRFDEKSALKKGYKHTYTPHSCRHCSRIVLEEVELEPVKDGVAYEVSSLKPVCLANRISDALLARDEGCPLFEYLLDSFGRSGASFDLLDLDGSKKVYGSYRWGWLSLYTKPDSTDSICHNYLRLSIPSGKHRRKMNLHYPSRYTDSRPQENKADHLIATQVPRKLCSSHETGSQHACLLTRTAAHHHHSPTQLILRPPGSSKRAKTA